MENKRFIAGATCPKCSEIDKIFTYVENNKNWRSCAACDFKESFDEETSVVPEELTTRVNQHRMGEKPLLHETPVEPVKVIDSQKK